MKKIKVYLNQNDSKGKPTGRKVVETELISENESTVVVKLPDGKIINRKKSRQVVID